jgi:tetratricopeptide (TPR) repeat protein
MRAMFGRIVLAVLLSAAPALARDKVENWVEVRSEHFTVATNSDEKRARKIAGQFERMRSLFQKELPKLTVDPSIPITVLAVKNEKDFRALEPPEYLAKGQLKLGGLFLRAPDKNYVLMRIDAEGEHPYAVIYHEYTHLLLSKAAEWIPLWLNEGLAEYYQNTEIHEKEVALGKPSEQNIMLLRQNRLLPLATLFAVDEKSPYYHQENKGSIFYAESWALTHYIEIEDFQQKTQRLTEYGKLLVGKVEPLTAATTAFGDLKRLQSELDKYVQRDRFMYFPVPLTTQVDESSYKVQTLSPAESNALRADFLAYNQRTADARALLDQVLEEDPNNVTAHETMGFLEFQDHHLEEARKWYTQAVQLDSQSYLAHYYFAAISMSEPSADEAQIESSLRTSIKLNPSFAPSYDRLAVFLGMHNRDLNEARMMAVTAVSLDPGNTGYRINVANVLLRLHDGKNAVTVLRAAANVAKTPQDIQAVDNALMYAMEYDSSQEEAAEPRPTSSDKVTAVPGASMQRTPSDTNGPSPDHSDRFVASGPHRFVVGVLKGVHCDPPQIDLTVESAGKSLALNAENYYDITFTALNFAPSADLNPCRDLEGRPAKVEYVESADKSAVARVLAVELHK